MKRHHKKGSGQPSPEAIAKAVASCRVGPIAFFEKNISRHGFLGKGPPSTAQGECVLFGFGVQVVAKTIGFPGIVQDGARYLRVSNNMRKRAKKLGVKMACQLEVDEFFSGS